MLILMDLKLRLQRVLQIVEDAERSGALSDLERDIILAELREAYSEVKFGETVVEKSEPMSSEVCAEAPLECVDNVPEEEENDNEPEVEFEIIFNEEDDEDEADENEEAPQQIEESVPEPESVVEPVPVAESEPVVESNVVEEPIPTPQPLNSTPRRSPILSLYEDAAPVVGEQFGEKMSVGDTIVCTKGVAESTPVASLRDAIGVADKFMLISELFDGDGEAYEIAIDRLDSIATLEDCVIYIAENYSWNAQSESVKFMMELLQRKFNA